MNPVLVQGCHRPSMPSKSRSYDDGDDRCPQWFQAFLADRAVRKPSMHTIKAYRQDFMAIATTLVGMRWPASHSATAIAAAVVSTPARRASRRPHSLARCSARTFTPASRSGNTGADSSFLPIRKTAMGYVAMASEVTLVAAKGPMRTARPNNYLRTCRTWLRLKRISACPAAGRGLPTLPPHATFEPMPLTIRHAPIRRRWTPFHVSA